MICAPPANSISGRLTRSLAPLLSTWLLLWGAPAFAAPNPSLIHDPPERAQAGQSLTIEGTLVNGAGIDKVVIRYRGPAQPFVEARMDLQYGDLYRGQIPALKMRRPGIEYFIEGVGFDGKAVVLHGSEKRPTRVLVTGDSPAQPEEPKVEPKVEPRVEPKVDPRVEPRVEPKVEPRVEPKVDPKTRVEPKTKPEPKTRVDPSTEPEPQPPPEKGNPRVKREAPPAASTRTPEEEELAVYTAADEVAVLTRADERDLRRTGFATVYDERTLKGFGARTVHDALDVVPGLSLSRDFQGFHRISVRGLRVDPEVVFLIDGHRLNNVYDGRALGNLPIEHVERIEVNRGPGPLSVSGGLLATVNIVTKRRQGLDVALTGGAFGTFDGHLRGARSFGSVTLFGDAEYWQQDGYRKRISRDQLESQTAEQDLRDTLEPVGFTDDRRRLINAGVGVQFTSEKAGDLVVQARFLQENRGALVGAFDAVGAGSELSWSVLLADARYTTTLGDKAKLKLGAFGDLQNVSRRFQVTPAGFKTNATNPQGEFPDGLADRTSFATLRFGATAAGEVNAGAVNTLYFGVDVTQEQLASFDYETNFDPDNGLCFTPAEGGECIRDFARPQGTPLPQDAEVTASRLSLAGYVGDRLSLAERLDLDVGLRVDVVQLPAIAAGAEPQKRSALALNPRLSLSVAATESIVLKLQGGRGYRPPTLQELAETIPNSTFSGGRFAGNPDLDPAVGDVFLDLGGELVQRAADARVRLGGSVFFQSLSSVIHPVDLTGNVAGTAATVLRNREGARSIGAEGQATLQVSERARAFVNASFSRTEDLETPTQFRLITDTPQARFNAGTSMPVGRYFNLDVLARVGTERRNNSRSVLELIRRYQIPAFAMVGAQLRTEPLLDGRLELTLGGQNLFDQSIVDDAPRPDRVPGQIPREGISGYLTVRGKF